MKKCLAASALALSPFVASAQADPADPTAPVVSTAYQSLFTANRAPVDETGSPNEKWRSANDLVGSIGGHAAIMKRTGEATAGKEETAVQPRAPADSHKHH